MARGVCWCCGAIHKRNISYRAFWTDVEHNTGNAKTKLKMPVLALGGKYSFGKRMLTSMQALAENVRGGEIDQCGHWVSEEQPEYLLNQLLTFFGEEAR